MKADYHIHCAFSDDSTEPMINQVRRAIDLSLDEICFTDHVDYGVKRDWDDPRGIIYRKGDGMGHAGDIEDPAANVDYPVYFKEIQRLKDAFRDEIAIKKGLEFGIQTITIPDYEKLYKRYADVLDFVLLSMHEIDNKELWNQDFQRGKTQKEYNDLYYEEIFRVQQHFTHYSVLAHLDLIRRYDAAGDYPEENEKEIIDEILKLAIKQDKGIEINTSSWHYGLKDTQPSRAILRRYKELGGKIITIGSDAHNTRYLGDHFEDARHILRDEIGFTEFATFDHMVPSFHPIED